MKRIAQNAGEGNRKPDPSGLAALGHLPLQGTQNKNPLRQHRCRSGCVYGVFVLAQSSFGPAATRALPASLVSYLAKFLMKRPARSFAFSSHTAGSA